MILLFFSIDETYTQVLYLWAKDFPNKLSFQLKKDSTIYQQVFYLIILVF